VFLMRRPSFPAWRLHNSLQKLVSRSNRLMRRSAGEDADAISARSQHAFARRFIGPNKRRIRRYVRVDKMRTARLLDDATLRVASVSLTTWRRRSRIVPSGCNVEWGLEERKR